jgi:hypothetical protein
MQKRRQNRRTVNLDAAVRIGKDLIVGSVLDVSSLGAFFRPEAGVIGGTFTQLFEPPGFLKSTAVVELEVEALEVEALEDDRQATSTISATVRWTGFSSQHACSGVGLEFHRQTSVLASEP